MSEYCRNQDSLALAASWLLPKRPFFATMQSPTVNLRTAMP